MTTQGFYTADWLQTWEQHHSNIMAVLTRRKQVAQANNDRRLLALLAQEQAELDQNHFSTPWSQTRGSGQHWWSKLVRVLQDQSQVSVEQVMGPSGQAWHLHDPRTGKSRYAQSAAEVMEWIEANHLGR